MLKFGIYAGSFAPLHLGHMSIINLAKEVFDQVIIAQGINPEKHAEYKTEYPFPVITLVNMKFITSEYDGLLTDFVKNWEETCNVTLVRGLRNGADLEYEQNLIAFLRDMHPQIKVVSFYCDPKYRHLSSSALRGIKQFSVDEYEKYIVK